MSEQYKPTLDPRSNRSQGISFKNSRLPERTTVIDSIVAEIKEKIISGELKDGDVLASQDELARAMGVSRASLREAFNRLSLMGLVEMRQGSGTYIKTAKPQHFMNSLSSLLIMDQASAGELLQARLYVEAAAAALAAEKASDEDIERLGDLVNRMKRAADTEDGENFIALDAQFHMSIAESSKNRVLMKMVEVIGEILPHCIRSFRLSFPTRVPTALRYHESIYQAVKHRDPAAARQQMEGHIGFLIKLNEKAEGNGADPS